MTDRRPYSYSVLRYVHDPLAGEFVNVGVVMLLPASDVGPATLKVRTRKTIGRMRDMFPDLDRVSFTSAMRAVDRALSRLRRDIEKEGGLLASKDALALAYKALPRDDSCLQWSSPAGSGLTRKPESTFSFLYERHVSRYDVRQTSRRSDEEVWKPVRAKLQERNVPIELAPKIIRSGDDEVEFQHAWKNGTWHVYEPISLDMADADGIYKKAHRWLGQLTSLSQDAVEEFQPHLIVGAPANPHLKTAYEKAVRILQKAPMDVEVFEEAQIDELVDRIEDEVRLHQAS